MPYHGDIHPSVDPIVNSSEAGPRDLMGQVPFKRMPTRRQGVPIRRVWASTRRASGVQLLSR